MSTLPLSQELPTVSDIFGRPLRSLRLSVTDRCNLRCKYCMPEEEYTWLPRETILSFEEFDALAGIFTELGVDKVRLTGGEPLLRKDLPVLIRMLRRSEEHTSELQSPCNLVCRLLLEKKKISNISCNHVCSDWLEY